MHGAGLRKEEKMVDIRDFERVMRVEPKFNAFGMEMIGPRALSSHLGSDEVSELRRWQKAHELQPVKGARGNRCGHVVIDGIDVLISYKTSVACRTPDGRYHRLWGDWSATTAGHVSAFGWNEGKAEWQKTEVEDLAVLLQNWRMKRMIAD